MMVTQRTQKGTTMTIWPSPDDVASRLGIGRRLAMTIMNQMPHSVISGTERKRIRVSEEALDSWMVKHSTGNKPPVSKVTGSKRKLARR